VFRLLQARGWDVIMIKHHNQAESSPGLVERAIERTLKEAKAHRKAGYRKIVLAGQSFGGYLTLEALDEAPDVFAAVALAPGVRAWGASGRLDAGVTDLQLQRAKVERIAVVFPKDDSVFGNMVRGESADRILARRNRPYLLLDETSGLTGHGGGVGGRFVIQFGACLAELLAAREVPGGRFTCPPPGNPWPIVRDLLSPVPASFPTIARDSAALPAGLGRLAGTWYSLIEESVVLFGLLPARDGEPLRALYRSSTFSRPGLVYDAEVRDGRVHIVLPAKDRIAVGAEPDGVFLVWTSSDGRRTLREKLNRAGE
jgi:pimeloyl-ACP methyl ester carboxylesterase